MNTLSHTDGRRQELKERALEEVRRFAVMFVYLWIMFGLLALNERIVLQQHGIGSSSQGFAVLNALVRWRKRC